MPVGFITFLWPLDCQFATDRFRWDADMSRWKPDTNFAAVREVEIVLASIQSEIDELMKEKPDENASKEEKEEFAGQLRKMHRWRKTSQSARAIEAMLKLARAQPGMTIPATTFDSKGHYLGVANGIIDLRSGELHQGKKEFLMTKTASVSCEPSAKCPRWEKFVETIMEGDKEKATSIQQLIGSCAVGRRSDKFVFLYGRSGQNGKSTLIDTIKDILDDYAVVGEPKTVLGDKGAREYHLATWIGKRMLLFNESARKEVALAEPLIKMSTDSGEVSARHPAGRPFNYQPLFTPLYAVNHLPSASMDPALWRRRVIVPFDYRFPDDQKDPGWKDRVLKEEGSGILNWIVKGAARYLADGLQVPDSIVDVTSTCKEEMDAISAFIKDTYYKVPTEKIKATDMRHQFITWCVEHGYKQNYSAQNFRRELEDRGYVVQKGTGNYR